jgi:hypothetical protein
MISIFINCRDLFHNTCFLQVRPYCNSERSSNDNEVSNGVIKNYDFGRLQKEEIVAYIEVNPSILPLQTEQNNVWISNLHTENL